MVRKCGEWKCEFGRGASKCIGMRFGSELFLLCSSFGFFVCLFVLLLLLFALSMHVVFLGW